MTLGWKAACCRGPAGACKIPVADGHRVSTAETVYGGLSFCPLQHEEMVCGVLALVSAWEPQKEACYTRGIEPG